MTYYYLLNLMSSILKELMKSSDYAWISRQLTVPISCQFFASVFLIIGFSKDVDEQLTSMYS